MSASIPAPPGAFLGLLDHVPDLPAQWEDRHVLRSLLQIVKEHEGVAMLGYACELCARAQIFAESPTRELLVQVVEAAQLIADTAEQLDLSVALLRARRYLTLLDTHGIKMRPDAIFHTEARSVVTTLIDELQGRSFLEMSPSEASLFKDLSPFGDAVDEAFPSIIDDCREAAKCLALDRGTACVFHATRALEVVLQAFGRHVAVPPGALSGSQGQLVTDIKSRCDALRKDLHSRPRADRSEADEMALVWREELLVQLSGAKDAWRNKVMHPGKMWSVEDAFRIYFAIGHVLQATSKHLNEAGEYSG